MGVGEQYTHHNKLSVEKVLAYGKKGAEVDIMDENGKFYMNYNPGSQFYVDSTNGSATGNGLTWATAVNTLELAIAKCTANAGDVIWVAPGHNEAVTSAAAIDFDVAGVRVIGLGSGTLKPTIDFDHANGSVAIGADNVCIENFRFRISANAVTVGVQIEAGVDGTNICCCEWGYAETATDEFAISLELKAGCNDTVIEKCLFNAGAQAAVHGILLTGASDNVVICDNRFIGAYSTACIGGITTLSTNVLIERNLFYQGTTEPAIELLTGTTGVIRDNDIVTNLATMVASIVADAVYLFRNYYNEDVNPGTGAQIGTASGDD